MPLRIAVDLRPLLDPFVSGVSVYTRAMLTELLKRKDVSLDLFYQSRQRCEALHAEFPDVRHIKISSSWFHLKSLFAFPSLPEGYFLKGPDVIWLPDRRPFYKTDVPVVMTVHDWVPEECAWSLSFKSRLWHGVFSFKRLRALCDGFLVPSSSVAVGLPRGLPYEVTYEGAHVAHKQKLPQGAKALLKQPFFLMISPNDPRKRLHWVLAAAQRFPKLYFAVAGLKKGETRFAKRRWPKCKNLFFFNEVSEAEKTWLLKHAAALLALSEYEGFDLPVLEALKLKCPLILSDIAVHNELYKSPQPLVKTQDDLFWAIQRRVDGFPPQVEARGNYTWEGAAKRALFLFRRVVSHKNREGGGYGNGDDGS